MIWVFAILVPTVAAIALLANQSRARADAFISGYRFPPSIKSKVRERYPHLNDVDLDRVMRGLTAYFLLCHRARRRFVSMPSQVVDVAWHEFILFTRAYEDFCRKGLGRFLHHTPSQAMRTRTLAQAGIRRAWRLSCDREGLDPKRPARLPLLFAIDAQLAIPNGFRYALDCTGLDDRYCAAHIGCGSGCGGSSGGSDGDGGGDGGGGCGGGD